MDAAGGRQNLIGTVAGGGVVQVTAAGALQLGNQGDTVVLVDGTGGSIDQVTYKADRVRPGRTICFWPLSRGAATPAPRLFWR